MIDKGRLTRDERKRRVISHQSSVISKESKEHRAAVFAIEDYGYAAPRSIAKRTEVRRRMNDRTQSMFGRTKERTFNVQRSTSNFEP